jgi:hypothetical protein
VRPALKLGVAALGLCGGGCTLVSDTICLNTLRVKECIEDYRECKRDRNWAEDAWRQLRCANPQTSYSSDYEAGFRDGFTHYLYWGGNCEPPPMPPKEYRKLKYQTPQGYQTIEDWFEGFRHGASVARAGGYRKYVTGPSASADPVPLLFVSPPVPPTGPPPEPIPAPQPQPSAIPPPPPPKSAPPTGGADAAPGTTLGPPIASEPAPVAPSEKLPERIGVAQPVPLPVAPSAEPWHGRESPPER